MWRNRTIANGPAEERVRDRSLLGDAVGSPSIDLNFAGGTLDPRIDFQRSTIGTYYRGQFNQNLVTQSQAFDDTTVWGNTVGGTGVNPVRTANNAVAPDGTMTADTITFSVGAGTTSSDYSLITQTIAGFITGIGYMGSVWMRGTVGGEQILFRQASNSYTLATLTTSWQRVTFYVASSTVNTFQLGVRQGILGTINSTATVEIWGAQQTEGSLLTPYIPTTTAAITQGQIASSQPWNLLLRSQEFDSNPTWFNSISGTGVNTTRVGNNAVAPDGTMTADTVTFDAGAGTSSTDWSMLRQTGIGMVSGQQYTLSLWIRGTVGGEQILLRGASGSAYTLVTATTSWQRVSVTEIAGSTALNIGIVKNASGIGLINSTATVELWGAQINEGSSAIDYRSTTSSALWLPRFENDPVTGEARGLLIEGGATNLCLQSADLATTWVNQSSTDSTMQPITAPDGTVSADSFTDVAGSAVHGMYQLIAGQSTTATYTTSCFVKKGSVRYLAIGHWTSATDFWGVSVDMDNPTSSGLVTAAGGVGYSVAGATITNVGNGWYRVSVTGVSPTTNHYPTIAHRTTQYSSSALFESYAGSTANFTYVWGFQYEQQAFASSYIPTTTATVARGADSAVMTGTNFSSWYNQSEGTVLAKWRQWNVGGNEFAPAARFALASGITNSIWIGKQNSAGTGRRIEFEMRDSSGTQRIQSVASSVTDPVITAAGAQKFGDTFGMSYNGVATVSAAQTRTPAPDRLFVGSYDLTAGHINSTISRLAYWPTRLPDATLQSLTT